MSKILIVGMGIGDLYRQVLIHHTTVTVDPVKPASYKTVDEVPDNDFMLGIICTPNFTHKELAEKLATKCRAVLIEKPGLETASAWDELVKKYPSTRFMMAKNNMYRDNVGQMAMLAKVAKTININWINNNRVPKPGTWFTNKDLAFGGVSRDLMPHLLSLYIAMFPNSYQHTTMWYKEVKQNHKLEDLTGSDYGEIDPMGVYNVDDYAELVNLVLDKSVTLTANWKSDAADDIAIHYGFCHRLACDEIIIPLGLCPESAYKTMVETAIMNIDDDAYWQLQYDYDMFIHKFMEKLSEG